MKKKPWYAYALADDGRSTTIRINGVINMFSMFNNCYALTSVPLLDTSSVTNPTSMFTNCRNLRTVPNFNFSSATSFSSMFNGCSSLESIPDFYAPNLNNINGMTTGCGKGLYVFPALDLSNVTGTNATNGFGNNTTTNNANKIVRIKATGIKETFSIQNLALNAEALNELFTNLSVVSGKSVTITGNPGAATCTRSIATAKGWSVIG